jgi:hypothetical protein
MVKLFVNDEVERILEAAAMVYCKSCPGMSLEGLKKVSETGSHGSHCLNSGSAKCETGVQANHLIPAFSEIHYLDVLLAKFYLLHFRV